VELGQDYAEYSSRLTNDDNSGDLASSIYDQQVIESLIVSEAADKYDVSEATIRKWLNEGKLGGYKDGNRWVISVGADPDNSILRLSWDLCARADLATTNKIA
jgi:excisionase family DNA binding protein